MTDTLTLIRHLAYEKDVSIHQRKEIEKCVLKLLGKKQSILISITNLLKGKKK